uniref:DNA-deoxyinosine glycosylase n=1 Tax=Acetatifactor sp. TaxID=1872090 RepID=UPI004056849A
MKEYSYVEHTFAPVYDEDSHILILGSLPSVKSRENQFYYGHPQNRFWKVVAKITEEPIPDTITEKKAMLLRNHIAVWDVIHSCKIIGSSDSTIQDVVVNDFTEILQNAKIERIYANGGKAYELYQKYAFEKTKTEIIKLPSTSPANAAYGFEILCEVWRQILEG